MSFIDLMGRERWSDADITRRSEALVRSIISAERETILNRKIQGANLGQYEMTAEDLAELQLFNETVYAAQAAAVAARVDRELLHAVLDAEPAYRRLQRPVLEPGEDIAQEDLDADVAERADAQTVVDEVSPEVLELLELRNPLPEPELMPDD